jgi:hypothetical protein
MASKEDKSTKEKTPPPPPKDRIIKEGKHPLKPRTHKK